MKVAAAAVGTLVAAVAVPQTRRRLIAWFTRVNGTWVGVAPVPPESARTLPRAATAVPGPSPAEE